MEKLFLILMCCILCSACEKSSLNSGKHGSHGQMACNEDSNGESEFIPGGFWPCDWIPHPHVPNEQEDPHRMVEVG